MYAYPDKKPSGKLVGTCYKNIVHVCIHAIIKIHFDLFTHATCRTQPSLMLHVLAYDWGMIFLVSYGGKYLVQRITTGQRMAESSVLDAHSDKVSYQRTFFPFLSLFCLIILDMNLMVHN